MIAAIRTRLRELGSDQSGFTVVEGIVAAVILVIGVVGTLQLFDTGTRNTFRAEESQVVNDRLQAELEAIKQLPYDEIALTSLPVNSADTNDPRSRVSGSQYALARNGGSPAAMVYNGSTAPGGAAVTGGAVDPGPTPFESGDISGNIHRFVTWTSDPTCADCGAGVVKRVIVAATVDEASISFERAFQEVHTDVVDPDITPDDNTIPDDEDPGTTVADFWLTDTPCSFSTRQPITANHLAHNTRGICSQGAQTGSTRGAPDLMYQGAFPAGSSTYDYATDSEPATGGASDIGILMPSSSAANCLLAPVLNTIDIKRLLEGLLSVLNISAPGTLDGILDLTTAESNKQHRVHSWVSPPIQNSGGVLLGKGTLDLFSKTINGAVHPGQICVWMSVRQSVTIPRCLVNLLGICVPTGSSTIEVDLPYINVGLLSDGSCRSGTGLNLTNFSYSQNPWPANWSKISIPMCFAAVHSTGAVSQAILPQNSRIVLSIMVNASGTNPGQGLEFMYDAVGYESRLELDTNTVLQF